MVRTASCWKSQAWTKRRSIVGAWSWPGLWSTARLTGYACRIVGVRPRKKDLTILATVQKLIDPETAGDPMTGQKWVRSSLRSLCYRLEGRWPPGESADLAGYSRVWATRCTSTRSRSSPRRTTLAAISRCARIRGSGAVQLGGWFMDRAATGLSGRRRHRNLCWHDGRRRFTPDARLFAAQRPDVASAFDRPDWLLATLYCGPDAFAVAETPS